MKMASFNKEESVMKDSQELSESLYYQLDSIRGALNLLRYDIDDSLPGGNAQVSWVNLLSVIDGTLERMITDADKLTDSLIDLQKMKRSAVSTYDKTHECMERINGYGK